MRVSFLLISLLSLSSFGFLQQLSLLSSLYPFQASCTNYHSCSPFPFQTSCINYRFCSLFFFKRCLCSFLLISNPNLAIVKFHNVHSQQYVQIPVPGERILGRIGCGYLWVLNTRSDFFTCSVNPFYNLNLTRWRSIEWVRNYAVHYSNQRPTPLPP